MIKLQVVFTVFVVFALIFSVCGLFAYFIFSCLHMIFDLQEKYRSFRNKKGSSRETTDDIKIESPVSTGRKEKEK